jgi:transposase InsO family protein
MDFVRQWSDKTELPATQLVSWLEDWEKEAIQTFARKHPLEGYRRLTFMMLDDDVVAVSPTSTYRVLKAADLLCPWNPKPTKKGQGFQQPLKPQEHWHVDISYLNVCGTFYYLCSVLDGCSRMIVHWDLRESMTEPDVEITIQRAREKFPEARPRIISDNGPQFLAKDFKEFLRFCGMTHVKTSPYYPQSNGKVERWHQSLKREAIRPKTPLSLEDARRIVAEFVDYYNTVRLHSALGYVTPQDKLEGRAEAIFAERDRKLTAAREARQAKRAAQALTGKEVSRTIPLTGETETGSAGEQPVRDSRLGNGNPCNGGAPSLPLDAPRGRETDFQNPYA